MAIAAKAISPPLRALGFDDNANSEPKTCSSLAICSVLLLAIRSLTSLKSKLEIMQISGLC